MKKIKKIFLIMLILINISALSFAHPGRTDSNGGHYNRKTGEYHYHDGRYAGQSTSTLGTEENTINEDSSWEKYKKEKSENISESQEAWERKLAEKENKRNTITEHSDIYLQNKTLKEEYNTLQEINNNTVEDFKFTTTILVFIIIVLLFAWLYEKGKNK